MKSGKDTGPSDIVVEMLKASAETVIDLVTEMTNSILNVGVVSC